MASILKKLGGVTHDAIHRFNARGESLPSIAALMDRVQKLEAENDRLRRVLSIKTELAKDASSETKFPRH